MSQRPEYFVVGNRSFETHPSIDENLGETEHRLKCGHLLSIDASIPHTDIRHCIVLGINPERNKLGYPSVRGSLVSKSPCCHRAIIAVTVMSASVPTPVELQHGERQKKRVYSRSFFQRPKV